MTKSLDDRFAALARVAKDLNSISDQVSDRFRHVEERLRSLGLGVEVELDAPLPELDNLECTEVKGRTQILDSQGAVESPKDHVNLVWTGDRFHLAFTKLSGTWRLVVRTYECQWVLSEWDHPDNQNEPPIESIGRSVRPLLDCPRDIRLAAAGQIDELLAAIERAAQERISRLQQSVAADAAAVGTSGDATRPVSAAPGRVAGAVKMRRKITGRTVR